MKEEILTLKEALAKAVDKLQQMEVPDADIDAWYLLSYVTGLDRAAFFLHGEEPMAEPDMIRYRDLVTKRGDSTIALFPPMWPCAATGIIFSASA